MFVYLILFGVQDPSFIDGVDRRWSEQTVIKPLHIFENLHLNREPPYLYKEMKQRLTDNAKIPLRPNLAWLPI